MPFISTFGCMYVNEQQNQRIYVLGLKRPNLKSHLDDNGFDALDPVS